MRRAGRSLRVDPERAGWSTWCSAASGAGLSGRGGRASSVLCAPRPEPARRPPILFEAAMAAVPGRVNEELSDRAARTRSRSAPDARYRPAALYHLGQSARARRARPAQAPCFSPERGPTAALSRGRPTTQLWAGQRAPARAEQGAPSAAAGGALELPKTRPSASPSAGVGPGAGGTAPADRRAAPGQLPVDRPRGGRCSRLGERDASHRRAVRGLPDVAGGRREDPSRGLAWTCVARVQTVERTEPMASRRSGRAARALGRMTATTVALGGGDAGRHGDRGRSVGGPGFIETLPRAYEWLVVPAASDTDSIPISCSP